MWILLGKMDPVILFVLVTLVLFSLGSWAILVQKLWLLTRAKSGYKSPLVSVLKAGQVALENGSTIEQTDRLLRRLASAALERLEKGLGFLATTASATPFIGLFGTVWGIMNAFQSIGAAGSTSLAIVAPGISEALVTTAIGLAVAIPALIGYNFVQGQLRLVTLRMDEGTEDFLLGVAARPVERT